MLTTWMRRWSWAIAMMVAIVITVGGLIILESGRLRVTQEYETALEARTAATQLTALLSNLSLAFADERGYLLTRDQDYLAPYHAAVGQVETLAAHISAYYQRQHDGAAQTRFTRVMQTFAAQRQASDRRLESTATDGAHALPQAFSPATPDTRQELAVMRDQQNDIGALLDNERARARRAMDATRADRRISNLSVAAVSALNIVLFVLLFKNLGTQIGKQDRVQRQLLTQRQELDRLVRERTSQLEALAWHLQSVSEDEKTELARELHDELGAILTASKMDVAWVQNKLKASEPAFADKLARALGNLDQGITLKRRIIEDMRPTVLTNFGLVTALRTLAEETAQRTNWGLAIGLAGGRRQARRTSRHRPVQGGPGSTDQRRQICAGVVSVDRPRVCGRACHARHRRRRRGHCAARPDPQQDPWPARHAPAGRGAWRQFRNSPGTAARHGNSRGHAGRPWRYPVRRRTVRTPRRGTSRRLSRIKQNWCRSIRDRWRWPEFHHTPFTPKHPCGAGVGMRRH